MSPRSYDDILNLEDEQYWYPALFIGAGYRSQNFTMGIRYDILYDDAKSIYANAWMPFVRVYFKRTCHKPRAKILSYFLILKLFAPNPNC